MAARSERGQSLIELSFVLLLFSTMFFFVAEILVRQTPEDTLEQIREQTIEERFNSLQYRWEAQYEQNR